MADNRLQKDADALLDEMDGNYADAIVEAGYYADSIHVKHGERWTAIQEDLARRAYAEYGPNTGKNLVLHYLGRSIVIGPKGDVRWGRNVAGYSKNPQGVDLRQCSTPWIEHQLTDAKKLLKMIRAGELEADPSWDETLHTDVSEYTAELRRRGPARSYAENPRKNVMDVMRAFEQHKTKGRNGDSIWTNGDHVYSYYTCLLVRTQRAGTVYVLNNSAYSVTTRQQQNGIRELLREGGAGNNLVEVTDLDRGVTADTVLEAAGY